jgi:hypothetical protein
MHIALSSRQIFAEANTEFLGTKIDDMFLNQPGGKRWL